MKFLHEVIEARQARLRQSALCTYIQSKHIRAEQRLSFIPAMLFFTMGFKDILAALRDENDTSPLQQSVHQHCDEDSFHWQWYLEDLTMLDQGARLLDVPATQAFTEVWSGHQHATREVVYHAIHLAKGCRTPFQRLAIIEALEGTFACFNEPMFHLVRELGLAEQLKYFGQVHQHAEASHAKDQEGAGPDYAPTDSERAQAAALIHELFDAFERMFDCWHGARANHDQAQLAA